MDRLECKENAVLYKGKQNGSIVIVYSSFYAIHARMFTDESMNANRLER